MAVAFNSLVQEVLSGGNRELLELAASGFLPLPPEQLLPLQKKFVVKKKRKQATASSITEPAIQAPLSDLLSSSTTESSSTENIA